MDLYLYLPESHNHSSLNNIGQSVKGRACTNHLFLMKFSLTAMKFIFPYLEGVLTWQFGMRTDCGGSRILLVKEARGFVLTLTIKKVKTFQSISSVTGKQKLEYVFSFFS